MQVVGKAVKDGAVPARSAARKTGAKGKGGKSKAAKPEGAKAAKKTKEPKAEAQHGKDSPAVIHMKKSSSLSFPIRLLPPCRTKEVPCI
jgi:hypothetical protein